MHSAPQQWILISKIDWNNRRIGVSVPHILRQKDGNENQKNPDPIRGNIAVKANKSQSPSSEMPILDDPSSTENLDGNWVRTILQEKERQLNNNNGCDLHEKCISTQKHGVKSQLGIFEQF